jgi:hypothetical protein
VKIGISKPRGHRPEEFLLSQQWIDQVDLSEWDLLDLLEIGSRTRSRIFRALDSSQHRTILSVAAAYLFRNPEALSERMEVLGELAESFRSQAILIRTHANLASTSMSALRSSVPFWVDRGRDQSPALSSANALEVLDPLWHSIPRNARGRVFKLHGWHHSRWVRYYGEEQLRKLARSCRKHQPKVVLFAHSMRNEEALSFREQLRQSGEPESR